MDYKKRPLWDQQGKRAAYQMYAQGYDDPITAYQILTGEETPNQQIIQQQQNFDGVEE